MKRVLIITYYFPPSGGAGVQRVLKFVKYLPEFGWEPTVLTVNENAEFPTRDVSLYNEIPEHIQIMRTPLFEPYKVYLKFTGKTASQGMDIATLHQGRKSFKEAMAEWIRSTFFIPDARCLWKRTAVPFGKRLLKEKHFDVIFSSAPPYTTHLIGKRLAKYSGKPWVADFRDSWVGWLSAAQRWWMPRKIELTMENAVLRDASRITHVSKGVKTDLLSRHLNIPADKWTLLTNGFDQADFDGIHKKPPENPFVITYTGSLYGHRNPHTFLAGLRMLVDEHAEYNKRIKVMFVGRVDPEFLTAFQQFGDMIQHIPYVSHHESIRYLLGSHALLLIIDDSPAMKSIITGKLYEYIGARRPVLAIAPEGEAAELIRTAGIGEVVAPMDAGSVCRILKAWITAGSRHFTYLKRKYDVSSEFNRKNLTHTLATIFNSIDQSKSSVNDKGMHL